jgi:V/A-type H+/Na+-transporting ATPase subunit E
MDVQLQELIDKIKSDGVASAQKTAAEIITKAEQEAKDIVGTAEREAGEIVLAAKRDQEQTVRTGKDALTQAARDTVLNLQAQLTALFDAIIREEASEALSGNALESIIQTLLSSWSAESAGNIDLLLSESELERSGARLRAKLAKQIGEGMEIKSAQGLSGGFRVSVKDGSAYYNFTPSEIAEALGEYLNPRLVEILKQATAN